MGLDLTTFEPALKSHYTNDRVEDMVYKRNPFLALIPKMEDFGGNDLPIPLVYGDPQGRSATFAQAQTRGAATSSLLKKFTLTRVKNYSIATIDGETLEASKGNANSFMEAATTEIDGAIRVVTNDHAFEIFRAGYGARGVIGSVSSVTITLATTEDIVNFDKNMQLVFAASESGDALRASGGALTVSSIDRSAGTLTMSANISTLSGVTAGDYIFVKGDREDSATPARTKISGLQAWIPYTAPDSTTFFGVDRTSDITRLSGLRDDFSTMPIEEALIEAESLVNREGGALDHIFINHKQMKTLKKGLGTKVQYVDMVANPRISFRGVQLDGDYGTINVLADRNCPVGYGFGLELALWKLYSLGKAVRVLNADGLQWLRQTSDDGVELRYGFYGNIGCRGPGNNIQFKLG